MKFKINNVKCKLIFKILMFILIPVMVYYVFDIIIDYLQNNIIKIVLNSIGWPIIFISVSVSFLYFMKLLEYIFDNDLEKDSQRQIISNKLKATLLTSNEKQDKDIINLMIENMVEIREYFNISKKQAKYSFTYAVVATIFGFIMFVIAILISIIYKQINVSIITAIGASITELISVVALKINKAAQKQLNYYYDALHENEQYLSTLSLISKISKDKQDDVYIDVIKNYLQKNIMVEKNKKHILTNEKREETKWNY